MTRFDACFDFVLKEEGGYVDHPKDPGGVTNLGVTKATWEKWIGRKVTPEDMRKLTPEAVKPLYKKQYWDRVRASELPQGIDLAMFDFAVNSGPVTAIRCLQMVVEVEIDGILGPGTHAAAWRMDGNDLILGFCEVREDYLRSLPHFATFGRGWLNRISRVKSAALASKFH